MNKILKFAVLVCVLSVANASRGAFFNDFDRPNGNVGNGWSVVTTGTVTSQIVDNEALVAGTAPPNWVRSGISGRLRGTRESPATSRMTMLSVSTSRSAPSIAMPTSRPTAGPGAPWNTPIPSMAIGLQQVGVAHEPAPTPRPNCRAVPTQPDENQRRVGEGGVVTVTLNGKDGGHDHQDPQPHPASGEPSGPFAPVIADAWIDGVRLYEGDYVEPRS